jgi:hypothetical protein
VTAAIGAFATIKVAQYSASAQHSASKEDKQASDQATSVNGEWIYTVVSDQGYGKHVGTLTLLANGASVTGRMQTWDNSKDFVQGTFADNTMELSRDSGFDTVQHYTLKGSVKILKGTFWNTGRYADSGTIEITR